MRAHRTVTLPSCISALRHPGSRPIPTLRLRALAALVLVGASTCTPLTRSAPRSRTSSSPYVVVSAHGASAVFPAESMTHWGWDPAIPAEAAAPHVWEARVDGVDGVWAMRWQVRRAHSSVPSHASLATLLAHGEGSLCRLEYGPVCEPTAVGAIDAGGRVTLGIADSLAVVRMFGDRPRWATFVRELPGLGSAQVIDSIPIEYAEPGVDAPDGGLRERALGRRRRTLVAASRLERRISAGPEHDGPLWIGPGESVIVTATETRCRERHCLPTVPLASDSAWRTGDAGIAHVDPLPSDGSVARAVLAGVQPGRTIIRIGGVRSEADTLFDGTVAPSMIEREVIVRDAIRKVWLHPRPDTVVIGQPVRFRLVPEGPYGDPVLEAPAGVFVLEGTRREHIPGAGHMELSFDTPGRHTVIPYAGLHAETLTVTVLARRPMGRVADYAPDRPHVLVSAEEARFIFSRVRPPPADAWGWGTRERGRYSWTVWLDGLEGRRLLHVSPPHVEGPPMEAGHAFNSLKDLVASMEPRECDEMEWTHCSMIGLDARVETGRVVLTLRDRSAIERLFRLRPAVVEIDESFPGDTNSFPEHVKVVYVDPQLPLPDAEFRAYADRRRRAHLSTGTYVARAIVAPGGSGERIQLAVGDTVELATSETISLRGQQIASGPLSIDGWAVQDTTIAVLIDADPSDRISGRRVPAGPRARLVARSPGETTVRAFGLRGVADTLVTRGLPARQASRAVLVTPHFARFAVVPRPEEVQVGDTVRFELQAFDAAGARVAGVPGSISLSRGNWTTTVTGSSSRRLRFEEAGTYLVIGRIGALADTVVVVARPR